ncbi:Gfo/Idh/MocA family protein [Streptomyces sp. NPDC087850]|uniref:Gfo/Idh/MocA family protein n=1 Tax=Streptomyces sp. NPDC087850 TaxID=3365809 RepID=UPI00380EFFBA
MCAPLVRRDHRRPDIDAVYVPTPAALRGHWTRRAIEAGKHVLCEKPFMADAEEVAAVARLAESSGLVVMEASHSRHHPMRTRVAELTGSGALGELRTARAEFAVPHADTTGIRWQRELGGGALIDPGCYPVRLPRHLFGEPQVTGARADGVDASATARLAFPGGVSAEVVASVRTERPHTVALHVTGSAGALRAADPTAVPPLLRGLLPAAACSTPPWR